MRKPAFTFGFCLVLLATSSAQAETYYASPAGGGDGATEAMPFHVADFVAMAMPGDVLVLLDGHYVGDSSMIVPPEAQSGTDGSPITVRALHDGAADIDGEGARQPISLETVDWWVVEGVNAHGAGGDGINHSVVSISHGSHNVLRRIVAWDAADGNTNIFGVHNGDYNLVEDCAGFGVARKVFSTSQQGNHTTFRRCWGRWEGSHAEGPKCTFSISYNSYDALLENCIATWDAVQMQQSYELHDYSGVGVGQHFENYEVQMATGLITHDGFDDGVPDVANARVIGSLAYLTPEERFSGSFRVWFGPMSMSLKGIELRDVVTVVEPGGHDDIWPLYLQELGAAGASSATHLTVVGAADMSVHADWTTSNIYNSHTCDALVAGGSHVLDATRSGVAGGATMMNRTVDGTLTTQPLWPWPMNQRILDAMSRAGRTPVDVTRAAFELCGGTLPPEYANTPDGGVGTDAGVGSDASASGDAASGADGSASRDGSTAADGGGAAPAGDGCSCSIANSASPSAAGCSALIAIALLAFARRMGRS